MFNINTSYNTLINNNIVNSYFMEVNSRQSDFGSYAGAAGLIAANMLLALGEAASKTQVPAQPIKYVCTRITTNTPADALYYARQAMQSQVRGTSFIFVNRSITNSFDDIIENYADYEVKHLSTAMLVNRGSKARVYRRPEVDRTLVVVNSTSGASFEDMMSNCTVLQIAELYSKVKDLDTYPAQLLTALEAFIAGDVNASIIAVNSYINSFDIATLELQKQKAQLCQIVIGAKKEVVRRNVDDNMRKYNNLIIDLTRTQAALQDAQLMEAGLTLMKEDEMLQDLEYLLNHKSITMLPSSSNNLGNNNVIRIKVKTQLQYYDKAATKRIMENPRAEFKAQYDNHKYAKAFKFAMLDKDVKIFITQVLYFNLVTGTITAGDNRTGDARGLMPNPHLHRFNCFGDSTTAIRNAVLNYDYTLAVEQIVACVGSINVLEDVTFDYWIRCFLIDRTDVKCILWQDKEYSMQEFADLFEEGETTDEISTDDTSDLPTDTAEDA